MVFRATKVKTPGILILTFKIFNAKLSKIKFLSVSLINLNYVEKVLTVINCIKKF